MSASAALAIFSSIGSGMIALTGIVFSLAFVMVQFSSTAYSPRLVLWIARDPTMWHAMGVFSRHVPLRDRGDGTGSSATERRERRSSAAGW